MPDVARSDEPKVNKAPKFKGNPNYKYQNFDIEIFLIDISSLTLACSRQDFWDFDIHLSFEL
jgi:hypothetical protein